MQQQERCLQRCKQQRPLPAVSQPLPRLRPGGSCHPRESSSPSKQRGQTSLMAEPYKQPDNVSTNNKLGAKDSQWRCFPPHFLSKMYQTGLKAIPDPGVRRKMRNGSRIYPGVRTKPFPPGGGREGNKRSRRFGPSIITAQPKTNNPTYVKRSKKA